MFRSIFARQGDNVKETKETETPANADEAIIHQFVPDEVLDLAKEESTPEDTSWMDAKEAPNSASAKAPLTKAPVSKAPEPVSTLEKAVAEQKTKEVSEEVHFQQVANPAAESRPKYPYGWLVVVEGAGVGEWFVLERGVSHIGSGSDQTVCLDFADAKVETNCHVELAYDENDHVFVITEGSKGALRVNGREVKTPTRLRDGDIITVGGESLRLVGLCTPNFFWS